jgi:hypothetical protein
MKKWNEILFEKDSIMNYFKKEGSFSPKQADWIYKTSKALFK